MCVYVHAFTCNRTYVDAKRQHVRFIYSYPPHELQELNPSHQIWSKEPLSAQQSCQEF